MTSAPQMFNAAYIDGLRQGDPATEGHFVKHFSPILMRKLRRNVRSTDMAEDLRQETFLRVLAAVRSGRCIQKPERFEIYVLGVCNHVLQESWRERRRSAGLQPLDVDLPGDYPSAYALMVEKETQRSVHKMLARLKENEQDVLQAVLLDEQNKDEICRRYGVSRSYLRVLLFRAKKEFRNRAGKSLPSASRSLPARRISKVEKSQCATPATIAGLLARPMARAAVA